MITVVDKPLSIGHDKLGGYESVVWKDEFFRDALREIQQYADSKQAWGDPENPEYPEVFDLSSFMEVILSLSFDYAKEMIEEGKDAEAESEIRHRIEMGFAEDREEAVDQVVSELVYDSSWETDEEGLMETLWCLNLCAESDWNENVFNTPQVNVFDDPEDQNIVRIEGDIRRLYSHYHGDEYSLLFPRKPYENCTRFKLGKSGELRAKET